ncbi:MAG: N(G),N(G)-dimethylarginine dimethylaminohydrolase [Ilumatobacteraceae bacterium]
MKALVRKPSPRLEEGSVVHIERSAVDFELAVRQWDDYVDALRDHGWDIIEVPEDDESPDGVFIEDAVLMYEQVAIVTRPGTPSRTAEPASVEPVVRSLGYDVHRIEAPGTLEGGDVLKVGSTISSASPARPTPPGVEQVRAILEPAGATVIAVPVTKALHLKSAITALPDGTIIGWSDVVDDPSIFEVSGDARGQARISSCSVARVAADLVGRPQERSAAGLARIRTGSGRRRRIREVGRLRHVSVRSAPLEPTPI